VGWKVGTVGQLASRWVKREKNFSEYADKPLIDLGRIPRKSLAANDWGLGEELSTSISSFELGDVLFGAIRPYFHKVVIAPFDGVTNTSVFVIRSKEVHDKPFITLLLSLPTTVDYATSVAEGTKMPVTKWNDLAEMPVVIPPSQLRKKFARNAAPYLKLIVHNVLESCTLEQIRDTLIPKLISSEIRVSESEELMSV
jgi:type I restriction enzyme S subunit